MPGRSSRRGARATAVLAGLALLVTACSGQPGTAASVNGQVIGEQAVLDRTAAYMAQVGSAADDLANTAFANQVNRDQATDLIRHQLILMAETDQQITVTQSDVNSLISQQGGAESLAGTWDIATAAVPDTVHDLLVLEQMLDKATGQKVPVTDVSIQVTYVSAATRDEAVADRTRYLADPGAIDADVAADPTSGGTGQTASLLTAPSLASAGFYSAPKGSVLIAPASPTSYLVALITDRTQSDSSLTPDSLTAVSSLSDRLDLVSLVLAPYAAKAEISVNPRFGVWDPTSVQVVAANYGV